MAGNPIPVLLFVYARPDMLRRTLEGLKANDIPLLYVFCDGPSGSDNTDAVENVRRMVRGIDWCETRIVERDRNLGLGVSIRTGVSRVLEDHEHVLVFEDDIVCAPGTYRYMTAALHHYADDARVMSVAGWTHPDVQPPSQSGKPYFDGRFACWGWGTWRRAWEGMDVPAVDLLRECRRQSVDVYKYGADVPETAFKEQALNIWAVRFALLHMSRQGLCLHPPHSLTAHIGYTEDATHFKRSNMLRSEGPRCAPVPPDTWPEPAEHPDAPALWQRVWGKKPSAPRRIGLALKHLTARIAYRLRRMWDR